MKIEITDREYWLNKTENAIKLIIDRRAKDDKEIVDAYKFYREKSWKFFRPFLYKDNPDKKDYWRFAWHSHGKIYPSEYAWGDLERLTRMKQSLKSEKTGTIFIDENDLRAASYG